MKSTAARNVIAAAVVALALALTASTASAQEKSADNMQILAEKIKADKKLVVADNMGLTESEAKAFWPIYDAYQKDLAQLNDRLKKLIETYAGYYNNKTLTDANAKELTAEAMAIETAELDLKKSYLPKLYSVLPAVKVARYIQIENKIRAIVKLQIAAAVPLAP
jgi:Spy/CpxP family protein refolding chaperone